MERANQKHKGLIVEILSESFDENKSVNYIVKPGQKRKERIRALMSYSYDVCSRFGDVWITEDLTACALVLLPDQKTFSLRTIYWDLKLVRSAIGMSRIGKMMERESKIKACHPSLPFAYLWFIGVKPSCQNRGLGSKLLSELVQTYEAVKRPIYLETSVDRNLPWYIKNGFEIFGSLELGYMLHLLRRNFI